jgi:hypothetical protein
MILRPSLPAFPPCGPGEAAPPALPTGRLRLRGLPVVLAAALAFLLPGCAALQSLAALSQVRFDLAGVSEVRMAGVDLLRVRGYEDLSAREVLQVTLALTAGELPLDLTLDLHADNPQGNPDAHLLALDWTLFLQERETVSGALDRAVQLPSGAVTGVPIRVRLDLLEFFQGSARDLVELAAALAGVEGEPVAVGLRATPTVDTPLGPIRYPRPLELGRTLR